MQILKQIADGFRVNIFTNVSVLMFIVLCFLVLIFHTTRDRRVTMYGSKNCKYCTKAKEKFTQMGLDKHLKYIEVSESPGKELFRSMGVSGVPHFVSGDKSHTGYADPATILSKLA